VNVITDVWRQLVRRRLWPAALLLLGALVAVPMLLASSPAPAPVPAPAVADAGPASADEGLAKPIVALAPADQAATGRRHVLGVRKDPFQPAPRSKAKASKAAGSPSSSGPAAPSAGPSASSSPSSSSPSGGGSGGSAPSGGSATPAAPGGGGDTPSTPTPTPTPTPQPPAPAPPVTKPRPAPYSLVVRFGNALDDSLTTSRITRLEPLPDAETPVVIYLGPGPDRKSAEFLVDQSASPQGDGTCAPDPADCQRIVMHKGDTEFFDVPDPTTGAVATTYELDLIDIALPKRSSAHGAKVSRHGATVPRSGANVPRSGAKASRARDRALEATVAGAAGQVAKVVAVLRPGA